MQGVGKQTFAFTAVQSALLVAVLTHFLTLTYTHRTTLPEGKFPQSTCILLSRSNSHMCACTCSDSSIRSAETPNILHVFLRGIKESRIEGCPKDCYSTSLLSVAGVPQARSLHGEGLPLFEILNTAIQSESAMYFIRVCIYIYIHIYIYICVHWLINSYVYIWVCSEYRYTYVHIRTYT